MLKGVPLPEAPKAKAKAEVAPTGLIAKAKPSKPPAAPQSHSSMLIRAKPTRAHMDPGL